MHMLLAFKNDFQARLEKLEKHFATSDNFVPPTNKEEIISEAAESIKRANNIIIAGLPEEENDTICATRTVKSIVSDANIVRVERLGKQKASAGSVVKQRLLKVELSNSITAHQILKNKKLLKLSAYKHLKVFNNQTPQQVKYLEEVRKVLKQRQDSGETVTIKYKQGIPTIVPDNSKN